MKFQGITETNLSIFLFQFLHHSKIREIIKISPMATRNPATLSQLRSIQEISHSDPPVNHSIFRTTARGKILLIAPPIFTGFYE